MLFHCLLSSSWYLKTLNHKLKKRFDTLQSPVNKRYREGSINRKHIVVTDNSDTSHADYYWLLLTDNWLWMNPETDLLKKYTVSIPISIIHLVLWTSKMFIRGFLIIKCKLTQSPFQSVFPQPRLKTASCQSSETWLWAAAPTCGADDTPQSQFISHQMLINSPSISLLRSSVSRMSPQQLTRCSGVIYRHVGR